MDDKDFWPPFERIPLGGLSSVLAIITARHLIAIQGLFADKKFQTFLKVYRVLGQWNGDNPKRLKGHRLVAAMSTPQRRSKLAQKQISYDAGILL